MTWTWTAVFIAVRQMIQRSGCTHKQTEGPFLSSCHWAPPLTKLTNTATEHIYTTQRTAW